MSFGVALTRFHSITVRTIDRHGTPVAKAAVRIQAHGNPEQHEGTGEAGVTHKKGDGLNPLRFQNSQAVATEETPQRMPLYRDPELAASKLMHLRQGSVRMVDEEPCNGTHMLGAQHSQSVEALYTNWPGLKVVMPSTPADAVTDELLHFC